MTYLYRLTDSTGVVMGAVDAVDARHAAVRVFTDESVGEAFRKLHDVPMDAVQAVPANNEFRQVIEGSGYSAEFFKSRGLNEADTHTLWHALVQANVPVAIARVTEPSDKAVSVAPRFAPHFWIGGFDTVEGAREGCARLQLTDVLIQPQVS